MVTIAHPWAIKRCAGAFVTFAGLRDWIMLDVFVLTSASKDPGPLGYYVKKLFAWAIRSIASDRKQEVVGWKLPLHGLFRAALLRAL